MYFSWVCYCKETDFSRTSVVLKSVMPVIRSVSVPSPGSMLEMHVVRLCLRPLLFKAWGGWGSSLGFYTPFGWPWCVLKFKTAGLDNICSGWKSQLLITGGAYIWFNSKGCVRNYSNIASKRRVDEKRIAWAASQKLLSLFLAIEILRTKQSQDSFPTELKQIVSVLRIISRSFSFDTII